MTPEGKKALSGFWARWHAEDEHLSSEELWQFCNLLCVRVAEMEAQMAELYDLLDDAQPQNTEDCAYNAEWDRRRIAVLARTAPKEQCRVDVGGYPCEEPRPCAEHDRTAPKDPQP